MTVTAPAGLEVSALSADSEQPGNSSSEQDWSGETHPSDRGSSHQSAEKVGSLPPDPEASLKHNFLRVTLALPSVRARLSKHQPQKAITMIQSSACALEAYRCMEIGLAA